MGRSGVPYRGVRYKNRQWVAEIRPPRGQKWWLGTFSTVDEAAYAYDVASTIFGCDKSWLNFDWHPIYDQIPTISTELRKEEFAAELMKVAKKYGKLAMESPVGELSMEFVAREFPALYQGMTTAAAASTSNAGETTTPVPTAQPPPHPGTYAQANVNLF